MIVELTKGDYAWLVDFLAISALVGMVTLFICVLVDSDNFVAPAAFVLLTLSLCGMFLTSSNITTTQENQIYQAMAVEHGINIDRKNISDGFKANSDEESLFTDNNGKRYIGRYLDDSRLRFEIKEFVEK